MKQTALVTGASEGIGLEFCKVLAQKGFNLILVARREAILNTRKDELQRAYGITCHSIAADLAAPNAAETLHSTVQEAGLEVDFLVNNAGILFNGNFLELDRRRQMQLLQLNIVALSDLTHLFASDMLKRGRGYILNVASTAAWIALPGENIYAASKSYVLSFTQSLAVELDATHSGVHATALCPGYTATKMLDNPDQGAKLSIPAFMILDPALVAKAGVEACLKGKAIVMPGLSNRIMMYLVQVMPRMWVTRLMGAVYRRSFAKSEG